MGAVRRAWTIFGLAATSCLLLAPAAHAAFGFQGLTSAPTNANAGANSTFNIHIGFSSASDDVKDLTVALPPGVVGNPTATPLCTMTQLQSDSCPAASQVGTTTANVTAHLADPLPLTLPLTVNGSLYNVEPGAGEPARFGIVLRPVGSDPLPVFQKIIQVSDVQLRKNDFGLNTLLTNIPNTAHALNGALSVHTDINSIDISLDGTVGGKGFMRNPTSCGTKTTTFTADSYANPNQQVTGQASYNSVNCAALPFSPAFKAVVGSKGHTAVNQSPPASTTISQGPGQAGLQNAQVLLPTALNPSSTPLANPCPRAKFIANAATCPASSIVGSARAASPDLPAAETGSVVIVADPNPGNLPQLGVDLHGPLSLQLFGSFVFTSAGVGQAFNGLPDIPISNFNLRFKQNGLLFNARNLCKPPAPAFLVSYVGWNGATINNQRVASKVQGCG
jgi:hypothetical protein